MDTPTDTVKDGEMVERVEEAIREALVSAPSRDHDPVAHSTFIARAVLQAMREPTEAMLDAGWRVIGPMEGVAPDSIWQAMIDEALTSGESK